VGKSIAGGDRPRFVVGSGALFAYLLGALPLQAQQAPPPDPEEEPEFEAVAEVEAPPREPTKRSLEQAQLTTVPGTHRSKRCSCRTSRQRVGTSDNTAMCKAAPRASVSGSSRRAAEPANITWSCATNEAG
jgi:hypothetical protein